MRIRILIVVIIAVFVGLGIAAAYHLRSPKPYPLFASVVDHGNWRKGGIGKPVSQPEIRDFTIEGEDWAYHWMISAGLDQPYYVFNVYEADGKSETAHWSNAKPVRDEPASPEWEESKEIFTDHRTLHYQRFEHGFVIGPETDHPFGFTRHSVWVFADDGTIDRISVDSREVK